MAKNKNKPKKSVKKPSKKKPGKSSPATGYKTKSGLTHGEYHDELANPTGIALPAGI